MIEVTAEKQIWLKIFEGISITSDETNFSFDKSGLLVKQVDAAHVLIGIIAVPKKTFKHYKISEKNIVIPINIEKLRKTFKMSVFKNDDLISIAFSDEKKMSISINNKRFSINYQMKIVDSIPYSEPKTPNLNLKYKFNVNNSDMFDMLKIHNTNDDLTEFKLLKNKQKSIILSSGEENIMSAELNINSLNSMPGEDTKSLFSNDYIMPIFKTLVTIFGKDSVSFVRMGDDYPIDISTKNKDISIQYMLAPRIQSDCK